MVLLNFPRGSTVGRKKKLTFVEMLKANRISVPNEFKANCNRAMNSSVFAFHKNKTIISYRPKLKNPVFLLSTMHHDDKIDKDTKDKYKPETFYNQTKVGVDVVNQMYAKYNVERNYKHRRMVVFLSAKHPMCEFLVNFYL